MSLFRQLVDRGGAVMREWHTNEGIDDSGKLMIAELSAVTLANINGETMKNWTPEQRVEYANAMRIALTTAYQIGRNASSIKQKKDRSKNRKQP